MAVENIKSAAITNLDATPVVANEAGAGAKAYLYHVDGWCSVAAANIVTATSTYKLARIPVWAKLKSVVVWSDAVLDSNSTQTLAIDWNLIFSDSVRDGTPASKQGLLPTTVGTPDGVTAGTTTTVASYTTPNILLGRTTFSGNNVKIARTQLINNGTNYLTDKILQTPLWQVFGFQNGQGKLDSPGGFFDVMAYVVTGSATGAAGKLYAEVQYTN